MVPEWAEAMLRATPKVLKDYCAGASNLRPGIKKALPRGAELIIYSKLLSFNFGASLEYKDAWLLEHIKCTAFRCGDALRWRRIAVVPWRRIAMRLYLATQLLLRLFQFQLLVGFFHLLTNLLTGHKTCCHF